MLNGHGQPSEHLSTLSLLNSISIYRKNSINWLSPARDYLLNDWLKGIDQVRL